MEKHENLMRDKRLIKRSILNLRATVGSFTSTRVQLEVGLQRVSNRTVRRYMNELGYHYCRSRKKGLMTETDKKLSYFLQEDLSAQTWAQILEEWD